MYFFAFLDVFIFTACLLGLTNRARRTLFAISVGSVAFFLAIIAVIYIFEIESLISKTTWIFIIARLIVRILYQGQ